MVRCKNCGMLIVGKRSDAIYCGAACRMATNTRKYAAQHRIELAARARSVYHANPIRAQERNRAWKITNKDKVDASRRKYRAAHRKEYASWQRARNIMGRVPGAEYTKAQVIQKFEFWGNRCWICKEHKPLTKDHVKPRSKGGLDILANIRPACLSCNSRKQDKWPYNLAIV